MSVNPFVAFRIDPQMSAIELQEELSDYKKRIAQVYEAYLKYHEETKNLGGIAVRTKNGQRTEDLLSRRYEFGMDLDKHLLSEDELPSLLKNTVLTDGSKTSSIPMKVNGQITEQGKKLEMFYVCTFEALELKEKIERAQKSYLQGDRSDTSPLFDVLLELRYKEQMAEVAKSLATEMSNQGYICTAEEFREVLMKYKPYMQLKEIYEQINSKEKREDFIPEIYVMKNMSNPRQFSTISRQDVEKLIGREREYISEYMDVLTTRYEHPSLIQKLQLAENQDHDYSWGIVLEPSIYMMQDEPVNSPIFKGRITVERIGSFTEQSFFRKRQYEREKEIRLRKTSKRPQSKIAISQRLKINQDEIKFVDQESDDKYTFVTMRDYFYRHEASKSLIDNLYLVRKTDAEGVPKSHIIISPVSYTDFEEPRKREFLKNVYFSDYMIDVAKQNGGYAGHVMEDGNGFFISNNYNHEEIASAVLFTVGQRGTILDCRNPKEKTRYSDQTIKDLIGLLNKSERERLLDE